MFAFRIMFALGFVIPFSGAAWTRLRHFAYSISKSHNVAVLSIIPLKALRNFKRQADAERYATFKLIAASSNVDTPSTILFNAVSSFVFSLIYILAFMPEVVVLSVPPGSIPVGGFFACKILRRKIVFDYRDEWEDYLIRESKSGRSRAVYSFLKKLMTTLYLKSSFVVTETTKHVESLKLRNVKEIFLIPNGADTKVFHPKDKYEVRVKLDLSPKDFVIAYSGFTGLYYRLDVVVKAVSFFMQRNNVTDAKLVLIGEGSDIREVLNLARKLEVNTVYFGATHDYHQVAETIACADVAVVPYDGNTLWKNTYPSKFFEYCACGVPVLATVYEDSLLAKLIKQYEVGLIVPPMDVKGLSMAIARIHSDREFREKAGKNARKLVEDRFDRDRVSEKLQRLLANLSNE